MKGCFVFLLEAQALNGCIFSFFSSAQSATYRTVIDDVIANVRQDFEDMGIEKEVLDELQRVSSGHGSSPSARSANVPC